MLPHIATDGNYYFVRVAQGLFKLGTGEGGTHRNFVYHSNLQAPIKIDEGVTPAPLFYFKSKLVCLSRQRGRSVFTIINAESLKEEKTIEMKEEYIGDNVRVVTGDEKFYTISARTASTAVSDIWLVVDSYAPTADWSAINHVARIKLKVATGIEDLVAASFGSGANEPYSPSMQVGVEFEMQRLRLTILRWIILRRSWGSLCPSRQCPRITTFLSRSCGGIIYESHQVSIAILL